MRILGGPVWIIVLVLCAVGRSAGAVPPGETLRDGSGAPRALPKPAIILFWASWCTPCRLETQMLPQLARAAEPTPVIVIPMDAGRTTRELLGAINPDHLRYVPAGPFRLLRDLAGDTAGLPVAVALDQAGAVCAVEYGAVNVAKIRDWAAKCGKLRVN